VARFQWPAGLIHGNEDAEMQRCRDIEMQRYRDAEIQRYRDAEMKRYRDEEILDARDSVSPLSRFSKDFVGEKDGIQASRPGTAGFLKSEVLW
jgi:hypothetical protein